MAEHARITHPWVERYRDRVGFGVQVVPRPDDPAPARTILAAARLADDLGLDGFFLSDHPGYSPDPFLHLAAVADTTQRVVLGSVVLCAGHRPPPITARLVAELDRLANGRTLLGLGIGWNAAEFAQLGLRFASVTERQAALVETIEIVRGLWGAEPFTFDGRFHSTHGGHVSPPPAQRPGPPLILAGGGERVTLRLVAEHADACNFGAGAATGSAWTPADVGRKLDVLRRHCAAIGRPDDSVLRTHFTSWLFLGETEAAARAKLTRYHPQGLSEEQRHSRVVGTPEQAVAYYREMIEAGMQYFVVQTQDAADLETIELLGREVAPRV